MSDAFEQIAAMTANLAAHGNDIPDVGPLFDEFLAAIDTRQVAWKKITKMTYPMEQMGACAFDGVSKKYNVLVVRLDKPVVEYSGVFTVLSGGLLIIPMPKPFAQKVYEKAAALHN